MINNYRPISILNIFSKIFERIIKTRLLSHLEEYQNSQNYQNPNLNLEGKLEPKNLTLLSMDIYSNLNKKKQKNRNLSRSQQNFDSISHQILINTLKFIGIVNNPLLLLESYLTNRKQ